MRHVAVRPHHDLKGPACSAVSPRPLRSCSRVPPLPALTPHLFPSLPSLELRCHPQLRTLPAWLPSLPGLRCLDLSGCALGAAALALVPSLTQLRVLALQVGGRCSAVGTHIPSTQHPCHGR
jgi:hypothetical protein